MGLEDRQDSTNCTAPEDLPRRDLIFSSVGENLFIYFGSFVKSILRSEV